MFVDALGGLFSVVAQEIKIQVQVDKSNKNFSDVKINKTYGEQWTFDANTLIYSINLVQLISGVSKEFMLELKVPPMNFEIGDE